MKTVVIWDTMGDYFLRYFVYEGEDISHLNNQAIGTSSEKIEDQINKIMGFDDVGPQRKLLDTFPVKAVKEGAAVITMGLIP